MPENNSIDRIQRYSSDDIIVRSRIWLLLVSDVLVALLVLADFILIVFRGFRFMAADILTAALVGIGAIASLLLLRHNKPVAATHVLVAIVFVAVWLLNITHAPMTDMKTEPAYMIAALILPAFLLGVGWTMVYGAISIAVTGYVIWVLLANGVVSRNTAIGSATDFVLSLVFAAVYVSAISTIYERAIVHIKQLLVRQQEASVELSRLNDEIVRSEAQKRQFYRDTISSVTDGRLLIVESNELREYQEMADLRAEISTFADTTVVRQLVGDHLVRKGLPKEELFLTGLGEAMTNAVKHAGGGCVFAGSSDGLVWAGVADKGTGITTLHLPVATLRRGYSSKVSMGMGYSIMLDVSDRVMLNTGPDGTTVVLFRYTGATEPATTPLDSLPDTWDRVG